jgi:hypothetical protein
MDEFYLIVLARKVNDKGSKLSRVAKCRFDKDAIYDGVKTGQWFKIEIYDSPFRGMLDAVFVGLDTDPCWRTSQARAERMVSGLSLASGVKWEAQCGPIDADDAALLRVKLEVLNFFGD